MINNFKKIFIAIILLFGFVACDDAISTTEEHDRIAEYVPGQIAVGFVDTVSYKFVVNFCNSSNLGIIDLEFSHNFWAKADSNDLEYYRRIFSNDSSVVFINKLYSGSSDDTLLITISFTGINTMQYDLDKVASAGLNVYEIHKHYKNALLKTKVGYEKFWIDKLSRYNFVRYAELNYVTHTF